MQENYDYIYIEGAPYEWIEIHNNGMLIKHFIDIDSDTRNSSLPVEKEFATSSESIKYIQQLLDTMPKVYGDFIVDFRKTINGYETSISAELEKEELFKSVKNHLFPEINSR